jgi:hypothetical protein
VTVGAGIQPLVSLLAWTWAFAPGCDGDAPLALKAGDWTMGPAIGLKAGDWTMGPAIGLKAGY